MLTLCAASPAIFYLAMAAAAANHGAQPVAPRGTDASLAAKRAVKAAQNCGADCRVNATGHAGAAAVNGSASARSRLDY